MGQVMQDKPETVVGPGPDAGADALPGLLYRQLEIFHAIMTTHSVSAASRLLRVSQPSLSRSLRRLEDQLKTPLFVRHRKRLVPTGEAVRLFQELDPVITQMRALSGSVARIIEGQPSLFRFGFTQSVGRVLVPRALQAMKAKSPQLRVFLDGLLRVQHMDYLIRGQGECIVTLAEIDHPLAMGRIIASAPLVALLPRNHPLASKDRLAPADFARTEIIAFEHNGPHSIAIDSFFAATDTAPNVCAYVRFADIAVALAAQNVGMALVDDFTVQDVVPEGLVKRRLVGAPQFTARLYWNGERPGSRHVDQLGDALIAAMVAD